MDHGSQFGRPPLELDCRRLGRVCPSSLLATVLLGELDLAVQELVLLQGLLDLRDRAAPSFAGRCCSTGSGRQELVTYIYRGQHWESLNWSGVLSSYLWVTAL